MATRKMRLFISYKTGTGDGLTADANNLKERLINKGYDVWKDDALQVGLDWNTQLYEQISECDLVLLMVSEKSADSEWVKREVAAAKGAKVHILPLVIRNVEKLSETLEKFDLGKAHCLDYKESSKSQFEALCEAIEQHNRRTFTAQMEWFEKVKKRYEEKRTPIYPSEQDYAIYALEKYEHHCKIHIAAGNIVDMKNIDVFVNSENDYMQMARAFESTTVSSTLRYQGSLIIDGELRDDSVQDELNFISNKRFSRRPVPEGVVIATSSGHPEGELYQNNQAYYIFHASTVTVVGYGTHRETQPIHVTTVKKCVKDALKKTVNEVDKVKGIISPENTPQRIKQEERAAVQYDPISSIIFPLFGTGHAKRPTQQAAEPIVEAFFEFLRENPQTKLQKIYLCIHYHEELEIIDGILKNKGFMRVQ